jgi:hypothetical protein
MVARANWHGSMFTEDDTGEAEDMLFKALEGDPNNARIHAALAGCYQRDGLFGWRRPQSESRASALEMGQKARAVQRSLLEASRKCHRAHENRGDGKIWDSNHCHCLTLCMATEKENGCHGKSLYSPA